MSYKSLLQIFIIILISIILSSIYFLYFSNSKETTVEENSTKLKEIIKDGKEKTNYKLIPQSEPQISEGKILIDQNQTKENKYEPALKENEKKSVDKNILMEVEYVTTDNRGNKYQIFAKSAKTSPTDKDVLDLNQVRGIITSDYRSTIYIVSDFAKYNSVDLNSKFYNNVVINFEDKQIDCDAFTMNMNINLAEAYGNVVVTDPKSKMYAGIITLDIKTKDININPETKKKIKIVTE